MKHIDHESGCDTCIRRAAALSIARRALRDIDEGAYDVEEVRAVADSALSRMGRA